MWFSVKTDESIIFRKALAFLKFISEKKWMSSWKSHKIFKMRRKLVVVPATQRDKETRRLSHRKDKKINTLTHQNIQNVKLENYLVSSCKDWCRGWFHTEFRELLKMEHPFVLLLFLPARCTPVGQPNDAGIIVILEVDQRKCDHDEWKEAGEYCALLRKDWNPCNLECRWTSPSCINSVCWGCKGCLLDMKSMIQVVQLIMKTTKSCLKIKAADLQQLSIKNQER